MAEAYPFTDEGVTAALDALGDDSHAVARALERLGVTGNRDSCEQCLIANYLDRVYPGLSRVEVNREAIVLELRVVTFDEGRTDIDHAWLRVDTTDPISDFIGDFDAARYPNLERTTP